MVSVSVECGDPQFQLEPLVKPPARVVAKTNPKCVDKFELSNFWVVALRTAIQTRIVGLQPVESAPTLKIARIMEKANFRKLVIGLDSFQVRNIARRFQMWLEAAKLVLHIR